MNDLISRQAAIDAIMGEPTDAHYPSWYAERLEQLPSAQQERIIYGNMSDEEFEKWLYGHGICSPNIHESIPCDVVPWLIDNAISELPSAQPEHMSWTLCRHQMPENNVNVLFCRVDGEIFVGHHFHLDNYWVTMGYAIPDNNVKAWMPLPAPYVNEEPPTDGCFGCKHRIIRSVPTSKFYCDLDDAFHDNLTNCPLEQDAPSASELRG